MRALANVCCIVFALLVSACAAEQFSSPAEQFDTVPAAISPHEDPVNVAAVGEEPNTALIVSLNISETEMKLLSAEVLTVPDAAAALLPENSFAVILALDSGRGEISRAVVNDTRTKVIEGQGLVSTPDIDVAVALPLNRMPDSVDVITSAAPSGRSPVSVTDVMRKFCEDYSASPLCAPDAGRSPD